MNAKLALEDGRTFPGRAFGAEGEICGEVVFNTSMSGYQEILTDPSYAGQIVVMTYPHIGNFGMNREDEESGKPFVQGFVAREFSSFTSNWRALESLEEYLKHHAIVSISEVETRALVRHIRTRGVMRGIISSMDLDGPRLAERARQAPGMLGQDLASAVSCHAPYRWQDPSGLPAERFRVVAYDFGIKRTILASLARSGCSVVVVPARTSVEDVLSMHPDGVFLSNGPGDPAPLTYAIDNARRLMGKVPLFGICLGHQIMGLALLDTGFVFKAGEGTLNVVDAIKNREVDLVINTPLGSQSRFDEKAIRRTSIQYLVPCITTLSGARAAANAVRTLQSEALTVRSLQEYHT
jgi:carbamoyl-phosphate synthase small subunit